MVKKRLQIASKLQKLITCDQKGLSNSAFGLMECLPRQFRNTNYMLYLLFFQGVLGFPKCDGCQWPPMAARCHFLSKTHMTTKKKGHDSLLDRCARYRWELSRTRLPASQTMLFGSRSHLNGT